jgi:hypothetical protein
VRIAANELSVIHLMVSLMDYLFEWCWHSVYWIRWSWKHNHDRKKVVGVGLIWTRWKSSTEYRGHSVKVYHGM